MEVLDVPTEIRTFNPEHTIGKVYFDWMPQPGNYIDVDGITYTVLERRHRYQFRRGKYNLFRVLIYVQIAPEAPERSYLDGRWVIGDIQCKYNARSEILRCAVNPQGPCQGCKSWESLDHLSPSIG
ncbi:MAG: DUF6464 family protein [Pseudanabaenaceae cyanobacterium bins.39]|nr:DUF6464 family protein [Pseudanabaenaceae cyanobacterium bins.39]